MTALPRRGVRVARLVLAAAAMATSPVHAVDADSGVMFQRLRQLRNAAPPVFAAYVLAQLRVVSEIAAACGWAAQGVIDVTVDRTIVYLDTHLAPKDVSAAELRRRGLDAVDPAGRRQVAGSAPDVAAEPCEREGRHYRDWVIFSEVAGQPATPLPTTPSLDALVATTNDPARARAAYHAGVALLTVAERADGCGAAPFPSVQQFEEAVTRAEASLLLAWGNAAPAAAGLARLLGSERVRAEQAETGRLPCTDPRIGADWQLWEPLARAPVNVVELTLAVGPTFAAQVDAARAAACGPESIASATSTAPAPAPATTSSPVVVPPVVAAKAAQLATSKAFAQAAAAHARVGGCAPAAGRR